MTEVESERLASALRARAEKIRRGLVKRDASTYVEQIGKEWFPRAEDGEDTGVMAARFDDPEDMEKTAEFFETSGGVTLRY